ncbi:ArnT family glycosyltransferase [Tautonia rosea]|uniref:ArnT family glycosyltransferase n=1 Tax=Tautonia rosea TaxID=2728037 RepID=UPI0014737B41|nr:phospholipid carrier-dependent glycosyltransferase [Tautonia rosea]
MANFATRSGTPGWAIAGLVLALIFAAWWRGHTFAPAMEDSLGLAPWPVVEGESEPLDCDEAAYAYMARRLFKGDRLYADLSENKPPLGYWIYSASAAIGGANELTIRLLPLPLVLVTVGLVWWIGLRLGGSIAAVMSAFLYVLLSTDPYVYGNGAQLEQAINCFAVAGLAAVLRAEQEPRRRGTWLIVAGVSVGLATAVKQVAALHLVILGVAVLAFPRRDDDGDSRVLDRLRSLGALIVGFLGVAVVVVAILFARGVAGDAYDDIILAGRALATDVPPELNAPSPLIRWMTGNADPKGELPPPFGSTKYLVWWGQGSWPIWLVAVPSLIGLAIRRPSIGRWVLVGWTISALVQVVAPRLYWAHYYLLPTPGLAMLVGVTLGDLVTSSQKTWRSWLLVLGLIGTILVFGAIQVRDYLLVPSEQLTIRHKGGGQWVELRKIGRDLGERTTNWDDPTLLVWGWQSPLNFYSNMDAPSRHFFTNNLMRDFADRPHPVVSPKIAELMTDLQENQPDLVLVAYPPFSALREFLEQGYLPTNLYRIPISPDGRGLWVRKDRLAELTRSMADRN